MKEINLTLGAAPQIEINGHVFELRVNELEAMEMVLNATDELNAVAGGNHSPRAVLKVLKHLYGVFDTILGDGAMKTLSEGKPVGLNDCIKWLHALIPASIESYVEGIELRYE